MFRRIAAAAAVMAVLLPVAPASALSGPVATFSTDVLDFGRVRMNEGSLHQRVRVTNQGDADLNVSTASIGNDANHAFAITYATCFKPTYSGVTLSPGQFCEVEVSFDSSVAYGRSTAVLVIPTDDPNSQETVDLAGTATAGYWVVHRDGRMTPFGDAENLGHPIGLHSPLVGASPRFNDTLRTIGSSWGDSMVCVCLGVGHGYWAAAADGGVFSYGVPFEGSAGGLPLNSPVVGFSRYRPRPRTTGDDKGYWLVAADGGVFNYGTAPFLGSEGGKPLNAPIVGMAQSYQAGGDGYWLVGSDGAVFNHGVAQHRGSPAGSPLNAPVVGMAASRQSASDGYWLVASDGGIFSYGGAPFFGSPGGKPLNQRIVGMAESPTGKGYWLVGADGGVFSYGDAPFLGSDAGHGNDVVGITTTTQETYWG